MLWTKCEPYFHKQTDNSLFITVAMIDFCPVVRCSLQLNTIIVLETWELWDALENVEYSLSPPIQLKQGPQSAIPL